MKKKRRRKEEEEGIMHHPVQCLHTPTTFNKGVRVPVSMSPVAQWAPLKDVNSISWTDIWGPKGARGGGESYSTGQPYLPSQTQSYSTVE